MVSQTEPDRAELRRFSKAMMSRWYRLEVAAAIARRESGVFHATGLVRDMEGRVPLQKVSTELNHLHEHGLIAPHKSTSANVEFVANASPYWSLAVELERDLLE